MPSIPQSLLWISLVVLWLFVLVPMLINKRDTVRRTSDVALATRVLNSGRGARLIKRSGPAAGHRSDPDWVAPRADLDDDIEDFDEDATGPVIVTGKPSWMRSVAVVTALAEEDELGILDVDIVDEDSGALPVGKADTPEAAEPVTEQLPLEFDTAAEDSESVDDEVEVEVEAVEAVVEDEAELEDEAEAVAPEPEAVAPESEAVEPDSEPEAVAAKESVAAKEPDGTEAEYEYVEDSSGLEPEADEQLSPAARSAGYATKTAAAVSARKYRFRTRMLVSMAALLVVSAVLAFVMSPVAWYACGTLAAVTLLYLAYLRRQTKIEERLRRRRMQRLSRARQGVENTLDGELNVVPTRLRRPGAAVLEIDDEDPVFEHLEYASLAPEYEMPRAAGQ